MIKDTIKQALREVLDEPRPFNCNRCPRNRDKERGPYCPAWGSILLSTVGPNGSETNVVEACYFDRMEKWHEGIRDMSRINIDGINTVRKEAQETKQESQSYVAQLLVSLVDAAQRGTLSQLLERVTQAEDQNRLEDLSNDATDKERGTQD